MKNLITPVVIVIYHRPDHAQKLMSALSLVKPTTIWIVADGPKDEADQLLVSETRKTVEEAITWPCRIYPVYAGKNLGLKTRVITGLTQVFLIEENAIILEEDCLPSKSFFYYCEELLNRYIKESKVMSISGGNYLFGEGGPVKDSYYFSKYFSAWGWATWKRAWQLYNPVLDFIKDKSVFDNLAINHQSFASRWYWHTMASKIISGKVNDTWDYQWTLTHLFYGGISAIPAKNLVRNIGFGKGATHTKFKHKLQALETSELSFPLTHPKSISIRHDLDKILERLVYLNWRSILGLLLR